MCKRILGVNKCTDRLKPTAIFNTCMFYCFKRTINHAMRKTGCLNLGGNRPKSTMKG